MAFDTTWLIYENVCEDSRGDDNIYLRGIDSVLDTLKHASDKSADLFSAYASASLERL